LRCVTDSKLVDWIQIGGKFRGRESIERILIFESWDEDI